jgi:hypothetical protein
MVNGRAKTILLLETISAEKSVYDTLTAVGVDEIHIGLNDLHLEYRLHFMFELLTNETVERIIHQIKPFGIPFGFGGVGRLNGAMLPGKNIIAEHYRLGSSMVILSRSFLKKGPSLNKTRLAYLCRDLQANSHLFGTVAGWQPEEALSVQLERELK